MRKKSARPTSVGFEHAFRIAQEYVGAYKVVTPVDELPQHGIYVIDAKAVSPKAVFFFEVLDQGAQHVGGTQYLSVSKSSGAVTDLGMIGE